MCVRGEVLKSISHLKTNLNLTIKFCDSGIPEKWWCHSFLLTLIIEELPLKVATCQKKKKKKKKKMEAGKPLLWPISDVTQGKHKSKVQNSPTPSHPGPGYRNSSTPTPIQHPTPLLPRNSNWAWLATPPSVIYSRHQ